MKSFLQPETILPLLTDFILFTRTDDSLKKVVLRPHQMRAVGRILERSTDGEKKRGLIWHTQGSGKTYTMAQTIMRTQRPALILAHNKTLAAQLCAELRTYFPRNAVGYFVSFYDYYQPEAYNPRTDTYIEKDSQINEEIDRLRHAATAALFARRDVLIVASVSAIYGMGSPETYDANLTILRKGDTVDRDGLLRKLVSVQYTRNDTALGRGTFRVRGESLEIFPAYAESAYRATLFGDEVERLQHFDPLTGELLEDDLEHISIWPASHYNVAEGTIERGIERINRELTDRCAVLEAEGKLLVRLHVPSAVDPVLYMRNCQVQLSTTTITYAVPQAALRSQGGTT
mgnify:CR=1 FL=1